MKLTCSVSMITSIYRYCENFGDHVNSLTPPSSFERCRHLRFQIPHDHLGAKATTYSPVSTIRNSTAQHILPPSALLQ
jgi:hypothetical protein